MNLELTDMSYVSQGGALLSTPPPDHDPVIDAVFDRGSVVEVIGPSKTRKSFFAMQLSLGLAFGRTTCGLGIRNPIKVLFVNMELTPADVHRRVWHMAKTLGITAEDIGDRLTIMNLRDNQSNAMGLIEEAVCSMQYSGIIIDPIYPLLKGDESRPETWSPITALFNQWAAKCGFVMYVHHDPKGDAGERNIRDRGAGSGVAGRNAYARLTLTPHKVDPDSSIVVNFMLRGYAPLEGLTLTFKDDAFILSDAAPTVQTGKDRRARRGVVKVTPKQVIALVADKPLRASIFMAKLAEMGVAEKRVRAVRDKLIEDGLLVVHRHGFPSNSWYGTPSGISSLKAQIETPKAGGK